MSIAEGYAFATSTWGSDLFDRASGVIRHIRSLVEEDTEPRIEIVAGDDASLFPTETVLFDHKQAALNELARADALVQEACQICQKVCAEM